MNESEAFKKQPASLIDDLRKLVEKWRAKGMELPVHSSSEFIQEGRDECADDLDQLLSAHKQEQARTGQE